MKVNKYLLSVLSILILFVFIASASAADSNETTDVLSVDESANIVNNDTNILSTDNNVNNDEILEKKDIDPDKIDISTYPETIVPNQAFSLIAKNFGYPSLDGDFTLEIDGGGKYTASLSAGAVTFMVLKGITKTSDATISWPGNDDFNPFSKTFEITVGGGKKDVNPTFTQDPNPASPGSTITIKVSNFGDKYNTPKGQATLTVNGKDYKVNVNNDFNIPITAPDETTKATFSWNGDSNYNSYKNTNINIVVESPTPVTNTWYVNSSAPSGGDGSKEHPFQNLLDAVEKTSDGDTIMVAPGTYSGEKNCAYIYSNNLNIIKDGDGEAIFDSGKQYRILTIFVPTININGLTFKNGKIDKWGIEEDGGAIMFNNSITNSNINAKFINNFAVMNGGAIYFSGDVTNTNINIESINNDANNHAGALFFKGKINNVNLTGKVMDSNIIWGSGGAVFFNDTVSNLIVNAIFSGNVAEWNGGAIRFEKNVNNVTVDGNYTNNKAQYGAALSFGGESDNVNIFGFYYGNNANNTNIIELNNIVRNSFFNGVFINNSADNGSSGIFLYKSVSDCTFSGVFINNAAINGAALFYCEDVNNTIIKNAIFLNNKAISDSVSLTENDGIVEIKFYGAHDFLNAIWSSNDLSFDNVTYWGENGIMNTGTKTITPSQLEAGQNITITINNTGVITQKTMQTDANGTITLDLRNDRGKYIITAYHPEDAYYTESNHTSINFTIDKQSSTIDLSTEKNKVIANVTAGATGNVTFTARKDNVDVKTETISLINSIAEFDLNDLEQGEYIITAVYNGDENYYHSSNTTNITVSPTPGPDRKNLTLNASAEPIMIGENATIIVTGFENATGNVTARIQGGPLSAPIVNGTATFIVPDLTLNTTAYIIYGGDANYNPANATVEIIVNPKSDVVIVAENVTKYYHGPERFVANIYDPEGNPLVNKSVNITINGVTYTKISDANGTVSMAINLGSGTYDVTTTVDNATLKSSITVLSTLTGKDIIKYYRNGTQYSVQVFDTAGKAVGKGEVVTFNINGVFYNRTTDENGIATLNINLPQGEYVITAINPVTGEMHANNITVLPILAAENLTMKYLDGNQFKANLVDGQGKPYAEQFVTFNINGILYNRLTDSNGQAALNIRLPPGEYIITSSFNGCNIANKITVMGVL